MSSFEDLLNNPEDLGEIEIVLPTRLGASADKGGVATPAAAAAPGAASGGSPAGGQSSGTTPEPEPQLPEGSDPDEPDDPEAVEVQEEEDAAALTAAAREMFRAEATQDDVISPGDQEEAQADSKPNDRQESQPVVPRKGGGLSFEGESAYLKQFPRVLIDQMREILSPRLGEVFARDISQVSIVSAFVMATMGTEIATDDITAHAIKAFRESTPRTDAIDKRTAALLERQATSEETLKRVLRKLSELGDTAAVLEMGQAYALAERTAQLDTSGALPETIDVTQKRVVASRDNIRGRVKALQREEKIRAGRPIR